MGKKCADLELFLKKQSPFVIAPNTNATVDDRFISLRAVVHPFRFMADCKKYGQYPMPVALPLSMIGSEDSNFTKCTNLRDFGVKISAGVLKSRKDHAEIPTLNFLAYALVIAVQLNPKNILLAGFDGDAENVRRNEVVQSIIELFEAEFPTIGLYAITKSNYRITHKSIYAPS